MYKDYLNINEGELYDYKLIEYNNYYLYQELKNILKNTTELTIVGKGPTAKYVENGIGINQAMIFTGKKYVFFTDFQSLFGIEKYFKDIKYIFFPDYPQAVCCMDKNINYITVIKYLKKYGFKGKIFIFQTHTTLANNKIRAFRFKYNNTVVIPLKFFSLFFNIKKYNFYGIGVGEGYHKELSKLDFSISYTNQEHIDLVKQGDKMNKDYVEPKTSIYKKNAFYPNLIKTTFDEIEKEYGIKIIYN